MHRFLLFISLCSLGLGCTDSGPSSGPTDLANRDRDLGSRDLSSSSPVLAVAGSDFMTGNLSTIALPALTVRKNIDVLDAQPALRVYGNKLYVLDQTHGAVRVYDPAQNFVGPINFPTGKPPELMAAQANPHDIYIDAPRQIAYVTLYGSFGAKLDGNHVLGVVDLRNPQAGIARFIPITVSPGDTDNNPDADTLIGCGDTLYISLQNLDRNNNYRPAGPGRLALINLVNPGPVQYITLSGQNPVAFRVLSGCAEAIVGSGDYQFDAMTAGKGGVERVDLQGKQSLGLALTDTALGGHVSALDATDAQHVFVDVQSKNGMSYDNSVFIVDAVARKMGSKLLGSINYVPAVRVLSSMLVVLASGTPGPGQLKAGVYLGPATGDPLPAQPIDVGVPPVSVDVYMQ